MSIFLRRTLIAWLVVLCSCAGYSTSEPADSVQVRIEGESPTPLQLVTAKRYGIAQDPESGVVSSFLQESDTAFISLPYNETFDIGTHHIFLFRLAETNNELAHVRMRTWVDGKLQLDQQANMQMGSFEWRWGL